MSVRVLALDTTTDQGSLALVEDGRVLEEVSLSAAAGGYDRILFEGIEALLARHGRNVREVDVFASASGPGTFTGVRVGLTVVKGMGEAAGKPVVGVSNLRALASLGTHSLRGVVLDARRGDLYAAVYDQDLRAVSEEIVTKLTPWLAALPPGDLEILTNGFDLPERPEGIPVTDAPRLLAGAVGRIAALDVAKGLGMDPVAVDANYVRRSDAEMLWKDSRAQ